VPVLSGLRPLRRERLSHAALAGNRDEHYRSFSSTKTTRSDRDLNSERTEELRKKFENHLDQKREAAGTPPEIERTKKKIRGESDQTMIDRLLGLTATIDASTNAALPYVFEATEIAKRFDDGQVQALRGVNFCVSQGEFLAITGPSGCGKTTLLQMLGALDRPTHGTLLYRGNSIPTKDPSSYRALEIGFIFQAFHLLPTFTAVENVQIPMFETDLTVLERRDRAVGLLKSVGLEQRLNHFPGKLSGGERQRVAIARSLANGPSVLLADEPTGNLDSENARSVLELIARLHREQKMTLVLVTHDMSIAARASRTIQMKDGRIVSDRESTFAEK
jgi:ABC-type lipoprotein export system ATPase subunit